METTKQTNGETAIKGPRFPSIQDTAEQRAAFAETERLVKELKGENFKLKDAQGNFLGPFGLLSFNPSTFPGFLDYTQAFNRLPYLNQREQELSTLAAAAVTRSGYVAYAHQRIGISAGLSRDQVERASKGRMPFGLSDREEAIYELALDIAGDFGVLKDERFERAVKLLGKEGVAGLTQLVAGYMLVSILVNVADIPVPES